MGMKGGREFGEEELCKRCCGGIVMIYSVCDVSMSCGLIASICRRARKVQGKFSCMFHV